MALTSLKTSADLVKAALSLRDANLIHAKVDELRTEIYAAHESALAAQAAQTTLLQEVSGLKRQIAEFEDWDREKARYQLTEITTGVFVYATKAGMEAGEPAHSLCAQCFQLRRKSILQTFNKSGTNGVISQLKCHACSAEIVTGVTPYRRRSRVPLNPGYLS